MAMLRKGLSGEPVRVLQDKLGVDADGIFGAATDEALRKYQADNGLDVDGIAGPDTFSQMGLHQLVLLARGTRGATVRRLQEGLGIDADGIFGAGTEQAVRTFQESKGLAVDGMAGPDTLAHVAGFGEMTPEVAAASVVTPEMPAVDESRLAASLETETPPEPHESFVEKVEEKVAEVGKSIWNTLKRVF